MILASAIFAAALITNATDLASAMRGAVRDAPFELTGTIAVPSRAGSGAFDFVDESGFALPFTFSEVGYHGRAGDRVRVSGTTRRRERYPVSVAVCRNVEFLSQGTAPTPRTIRGAELRDGSCDNRLVGIRGTVRECFRDEIDPEWIYLVLDGPETTFAATLDGPPGDGHPAVFAALQALIGAEVSVCGIYTPPVDISRKLARHMLFHFTGPQAVTVLRHAPKDPFAVPPLERIAALTAADVQGLGRRRVSGHVLTAWHGNRVLLRDGDGELHGLTLADGSLPAPGQGIEATGRAVTDLYNVNLANAVWRTTDAAATVGGTPVRVTGRELFSDSAGNARINVPFHGRLVSIDGTVQDRLTDRSGQLTVLLKSGDHIVPVDATVDPDVFTSVETGCRIGVIGTCVVETGVWLPNAEFPHATGIVLVVNRAGDIEVLSRPPWWTPLRLTVVIGSLLVALVAIFIWNASLRRLAERRGRQLFREQVARAGSEMRIEERTRLAVELHDSISQNLTGASMQIDAAGRNLDRDRDRTLRHLDIASRTLDSCREELRNCIWDLRNQALDEKDMNVAIRRTVQPHVSGAELTVRFNVPRALLSDNTTHALLRIIRELATNAVRHGGAKSIRIAGALENGSILFSVTDDGRGFDPDDHPGIAEGHFGLQGVAERVRRLGGRMTVESAPGRGARIALSLRTHKTGNG